MSTKPKLLHGREVQALVGDAGGLSAVANIGQTDDVLALQARAQANAGHYADQFAQHRNRRAHVATLPVAKVRRGVAPPGRRIALGHVLPHDVARGEASHQHRPLVANHRAKPVVGSKCVGRGARAALLAQSEIDAADNLALLVEVLQGHFHAAVEQHPAVDCDALFTREVFRLANRRRRSAQVALDAVLQIRAFPRHQNAELWTLEAIVRNVVAAQRGLCSAIPPGFRDGPQGNTLACGGGRMDSLVRFLLRIPRRGALLVRHRVQKER